MEQEKNVDFEQTKNQATNDKKPKKIWTAVIAVASAILLMTGAFFAGYFVYASKLDSGMKSLIWVKETIQREYQYDVSDKEFYDAVFGGINDMLDDYSEYLTADDYAQTLDESTGKWSGLGIQFSTMDKAGNSRITVVRVSGNSPAFFAGVQEGSEIIAYGDDEESLTQAQTFALFKDYLAEKEEREPFLLQMREGGDAGAVRTITIQKEAFIESYVLYRSNEASYSYTGENANQRTQGNHPLLALDNDTAYIRLAQFNGGAAEQFDDAMSLFKAEKKKNLVLDLRFNGGGYMDILCSIAKYFCKDGKGGNPTVSRAKYKNGKVVDFLADANVYYDYFSEESKIAVLADNGTASASECLIGCMVDYGALEYENIYLCERVAQKTENGTVQTFTEYKTYGKGIMQSYFSRDWTSVSETLKLTTATVCWPVSGKCIHGVGVTEEDGAKKIDENFVNDGEIGLAIADFLQKA